MPNHSIAHLRREYSHRALLEKNAPRDPWVLFQRWFKEALKAQALDANAFAVSTVSRSGKPSTRMVLLKGFDRNGFVFFTNYRSQKGKEMAGKPVASLLFFWPQLSRQVRIEGRVRKVSVKESDDYFQGRPRGAQLSTWASHQSATVPSRDHLEKRMKVLEALFQGRSIPRPIYWGGFRVAPTAIEFWQGRPNRLHDRLRYRRKSQGGWRLERLAP
jgi:pyridoxamine 5'-phosphate oxidase